MTEKKTKLLTMNVTEAEKQKWKQIAKDRGVTLTDLIRTKLDDLPTPRKKRPKQVIEVDPDLLFEVNAIGNNLNQIARRLNQGEKFDVLPLLVAIEAHLMEAVNAHKAP